MDFLTKWYGDGQEDQPARSGAPSDYTDGSDKGDDDCYDTLYDKFQDLPGYVAYNPIPFQIGSLLLIVIGVVLLNHSFSPPGLWTSSVQREEQGFCCWRENPAPYFGGDPCSCPTEHRGDYACPPDGCTDGYNIWKRGPGTESNSKAYCHQFVEVASWCPGAQSFNSETHSVLPNGQAQNPGGFCCLREHPVPRYDGEPCVCPDEHRGYYNCPTEGCTDSTGARWRRGESATFANTKQYCDSLENEAAWCPR